MTLYKHQQDFLDNNLNASALIWSCGTGKTVTALLWAKKSESNGTLIITPKALKSNWKREAQAVGLSKSITLILSKEEFRRDYEKIGYFGQVIVEEVHAGFLTPLFKSQMSKALRSYLKIHQVPRVLLLTATPYTSSPWSIFNLAHYLGHRWNWVKFNMEFFNQVRMGMRIIPVPKKGVEKKLAALVKKIADVVDINDVMDVPLQHHSEPEYFALNLQQKKAVRSSYDPLPIVRYTKQHEIEQGFLIYGGYDKNLIMEFPSDKIDRIRSLVEENPKIAIICRYNNQINILERELAPYKPYLIRGDVFDRDSVTRSAEVAQRAVVLIQADSVEGYELPSFPVVVFASQSYSYVKWEQVCGRFLRMNKPSRTTFMYLITEGDSVDKAVYEAIQKKQDFKMELFAKK